MSARTARRWGHVDDQQVIQKFPADRADESFGKRVRPRRRHRRANHPAPITAKTPSKAAVNFASRSRIKNLSRQADSPTSISRFRACWVTDRPRGCRVTPQDMNPTGLDLDHEEHVDPAQQNRVDVEEVTRQQAVRLRAEEAPPSYRCPGRAGRMPAAAKIRRTVPPPPGCREPHWV